MKVRRSDLTYKHYSTKAQQGDNPQLRRIDARFFDRHEEYEVINMIEHVLTEIGEDKDYINMIETFITELPSDIRSRENVYNWLVKRSKRMISMLAQWSYQ